MAFAFWLKLDVIALFNTESGGLQQAAFKQSPIKIDLTWNGIIAAVLTGWPCIKIVDSLRCLKPHSSMRFMKLQQANTNITCICARREYTFYFADGI